MAAPVVAYIEKKTCVFPLCIEKCSVLHMNRQTFYFTVAHIFALSKIDITFSTTGTKIAATEQYWRLPSSPIVRKKNMCMFYVVVVAVVVVVVVAVDIVVVVAANDDEDVDDADADDADVDDSDVDDDFDDVDTDDNADVDDEG